MPEHRAQTHVQRALHSLLLDDEQSAAVYLLRALSTLRQGSSPHVKNKDPLLPDAVATSHRWKTMSEWS
jgi:hypothetical protein